MGALLGRLEVSTLGEVVATTTGAAAVEVDLTALKPAGLAYPFVVVLTADQDVYVRQGKAGLAAATSTNGWPLWAKSTEQIVVFGASSAFLSVIQVSAAGTLWARVQNNRGPNG